MSHLEDSLKREIQKSIKLINESPWNELDFYGNYLAQTYYYVRHSTRLLALAASRLKYEDQQVIHLRFIQHLKEESNHEKLALNDLKNLGKTKESFPELASTRLFYEPQYFKIEHERPLALMGYILFLEALAQSVCPKIFKIISQSHGEKAGNFFRVHGEEDPEHVSEAMKLISSLGVEDLAAIEKNLEQTAYVYNQILIDIQSSTIQNNFKKVA